MSRQFARTLSFALILIAVIIAIWLTSKLIVPLVAGAMGGLVVWWLTSRSRENEPAGDAKSSVAPAQPDIAMILTNLALLNLRIREKVSEAKVTEALESVIDKLRELVPALNAEHPNSELTWTVNQIATAYLPNLVMPFLSLPHTEQKKQAGTLVTSLSGLDGELDHTAILWRSHNVTEFHGKAQFLRMRFVQS